MQKWLKMKNITQDLFAKALNIHYSTLSRIVTGSRKPSLKLAQKIEKATNGAVTKMELLFPDDN